MSNSIKIFSTLVAVLVMAIITITTINAATSATVSINGKVSYTAQNYVGSMYATVSGIAGVSAFDNANNSYVATVSNEQYYSASKKFTDFSNHETLPTWSLANKAINVTYGAPSTIVYHYYFENESNSNANFSLITYKSGAYTIDSAFTKTITAKAIGDSSFITLTAGTGANLGKYQKTIPAKSGSVNGTLEVIIELKVTEPSQSFSTAKNVNFDITLIRGN